MGFMAGRGFGKTRVGAEWLGRATYEDPSGLPVYVVCPTLGDVKRVAFYGESGLMNVIPPELIIADNKSDLTITMRNCAGEPVLIQGFSAENPERLRGPQACRAWCFIAGTMVSTPNGDRPIETLQPGDLVLTRKGPRRVVANASRLSDVGVAQIGDKQLVGTPDHPVYAARGWTRLDRLRAGDRVCVIVASSGQGSAGTGTARATTSGRTSLFGPSAPSACTESGGSPKLGTYPPAGTYTTATKTKATTPSTILSACLTAITNGTTFFSSRSRKITSARASNTPALIAGPVLSARGGCPSQSVGAASNSARTASASSSARAATAASLSDLGWELSAASVVSTWRPLGPQYVYCLQVEGEPEYFANGILVHNCDELAAWQYAEETWDMMQMGLRLGPKPQVLWTTTPKPREIVRRLTKPAEGRVIVRGSTFDNKANLPQSFFRQLEQYDGTTLGRQELYGELIDPEESGIIKRSWLRMWPANKPLPRLDWIIMSLDTAYTEKNVSTKGDPDPTACGVWGLFHHEKRTNVILLDCWEDHLGLPDLIRRVKKERNVAYGDDEDGALIKPMFGSHKPMTSGRKPDILLIEDKGSGISLRQMLHEADIEAYAYNPGRADKLSRLHIVSPIFAQRRVWLPESQKHPGRPRTWAEPLVAQLCSFTGDGSIKHDDHVDQTTQALRLMMDKGMLSLLKPPSIDSAPPPRYKPNPYAA
jgi:predicted phage terminase large subunit-like protein